MATNYVSLASNIKILEAFKKLSKQQFVKNRVLGPRNVYIDNTIVKTDGLVSNASVNIDNMSQYIASSIFIHCHDGWNFVSRGVDALFNGDIGSTIHFIYYAELRAVMSLMAYEGIGIFNNKHIYFNNHGAPIIFKKNLTGHNLSTHKAATELITEWAGLTTKKNIVFRIIKVKNRTMGEWLSASGHSTSAGYASAVLGDWLKSWSIDLRMKVDQNMRNEMSYRPHFNVAQVEIREKLENLISLWEGMEPTTDNRFFDLDKHLLRIGIEQFFKKATGKTVRNSTYLTFINNIFDNLGESRTQPLYDFIIRKIVPEDHFLISEAKKDLKDASVNFKDPFPMICRAIILLRIATGYSSLIIKDSSTSYSSLQFWWEEYAFKNGITAVTPSGIDTLDMYSDISESIFGVKQYLNSINTIHDSNLLSLPDLCSMKQFHRMCFWGMGL
jgi:hypothetical protein